ncbi:hypothetical protein CsatA_021822 [Cannabis sativa]
MAYLHRSFLTSQPLDSSSSTITPSIINNKINKLKKSHERHKRFRFIKKERKKLQNTKKWLLDLDPTGYRLNKNTKPIFLIKPSQEQHHTQTKSHSSLLQKLQNPQTSPD